MCTYHGKYSTYFTFSRLWMLFCWHTTGIPASAPSLPSSMWRRSIGTVENEGRRRGLPRQHFSGSPSGTQGYSWLTSCARYWFSVGTPTRTVPSADPRGIDLSQGDFGVERRACRGCGVDGWRAPDRLSSITPQTTWLPNYRANGKNGQIIWSWYLFSFEKEKSLSIVYWND